MLTFTIARVIQEELLKDFANHSELSDWFGREDANPPSVIVRKPNPKNVQNAEKIKELEEQIQRYVMESKATGYQTDSFPCGMKITKRETCSERSPQTTVHPTHQISAIKTSSAIRSSIERSNITT